MPNPSIDIENVASTASPAADFPGGLWAFQTRFDVTTAAEMPGVLRELADAIEARQADGPAKQSISLRNADGLEIGKAWIEAPIGFQG